MQTLEQLRTVTTKADASAWAVNELSDLGFNAKSWQSGSWQLTLLQLFTDLYANMSSASARIAEIGFNALATTTALTEFADSHYDNQRTEAIRARHRYRLTAAATAGPYSIEVGAVTCQETTTGDGLLFTNVDAGEGYPLTLNSGSTLDLVVEAQVAGAGGNVAIGAITKLVTSLAGVTGINIDAGDGTSLLTVGGDQEGDPALRARNTQKWGSLSWATPADGFAFYAREGAPAVARVKVDDSNPAGPGTVHIYIAGAAGVSTGPASTLGTDAELAQTNIRKKHAGTPSPSVFPAPAQAQAFAGNIYVAAAHFEAGVIKTSKQTEIEDALLAYVNALGIGGRVLPPPDGDGTTGYLLASEWRGAVTAVEGVENIGAPSPSADVVVSTFSVIVPSIAFTYVAI